MKKNERISLVSLSVYPRSRRGAKRIRQGEGRLSCPPKTALERSYLTDNSSSENRILTGRDGKKLLTESPQNRMIILAYIYSVQDNPPYKSQDTTTKDKKLSRLRARFGPKFGHVVGNSTCARSTPAGSFFFS